MTAKRPKAFLQIGQYIFYDWAATGIVIGLMFLGAAAFLSCLVLAVHATGHPFMIRSP